MKLILVILVQTLVYVQGKQYIAEVEGNNSVQEEYQGKNRKHYLFEVAKNMSLPAKNTGKGKDKKGGKARDYSDSGQG